MALHIRQTIRVELLRYVLLRLWIWNMLARLKLLSAWLKLVRLILLIMLRHAVLLRGEVLLPEVAHVRRVARLAGMARLRITMARLEGRRSCICVRRRAHSRLVHWPDSTDTLAHRRLVILIRLKWLSWIRHSVDHPLWLLLLMLRVLLQLLVLLHYVLLIELLGTLGINMGIDIRHSLALTVGHPRGLELDGTRGRVRVVDVANLLPAALGHWVLGCGIHMTWLCWQTLAIWSGCVHL